MSSADNNQPNEKGSHLVSLAEATKSHRAFASITRELSDDELNSSGARKLLLERLAEAEDEITALELFRERFHEADKEVGVLKEKLKASTAAQAITAGTIAIGSAILGYAPTLAATPHGGWGLPVVFGAVLIGTGITAMVIRK